MKTDILFSIENTLPYTEKEIDNFHKNIQNLADDFFKLFEEKEIQFKDNVVPIRKFSESFFSEELFGEIEFLNLEVKTN